MTAPATLSATSVTFLFPPLSGTIGTSNTIGAGWSNGGLSGTISFASQTLFSDLDQFNSGAFTGSSKAWTYAFQATTDSVFHLALTDGGFSNSGNANIQVEFTGYELAVNGVNTVLVAGQSDFALTGGQNYFLSLAARADAFADSGGAVVNYSSAINWDITDPVTNPGGGGADSAVPEPAIWAMILIGFAAIGATMRRARRQTVSLTPWLDFSSPGRKALVIVPRKGL